MADAPEVKRRARGARPYFFDDPAVDKLLAIVMALAGEVSVLRDRLDTLTQIAAQKDLLEPQELDAFVPDASLRAERDAWRDEFLNRILRIVRVELEEVEEENSPDAYRRAIEEVGEGG